MSDCVLLLGKQIGDIHIALMDDDALLELNQKHLDHNDYTDVITFDYSTPKAVNCDIAVSTDRVSENATHEGVSVENELARVLIHGILHFLGSLPRWGALVFGRCSFSRAMTLACEAVGESAARLFHSFGSVW